MSQQTNDVVNDVLIAAGQILPPSGEDERYRIAFPASAEAVDGNSGDNIVSLTPYKSAVLTLTCYSSDPAYAICVALLNQQNATRQALAGGNASLVLSGEEVAWGSMSITQQAEVVSARTAQIVTWEFTLSDVTRRIAS